MAVVISIELWPKGDRSKRRSLGTIVIANDGTGTEASGNYTFAAADKTGKPYKTGHIKDFPRKRLLSFDLLYRVLKVMVGQRNGVSNASLPQTPSLPPPQPSLEAPTGE